MKINKSAFVRDLPTTMSAADVVKLAASKGVKLSAKFVHTIRYNAKQMQKKGGAPRAARGAKVVVSGFQGELDALVEQALGDFRGGIDVHVAEVSRRLVSNVLALVGNQPLAALSVLGGAPAAPATAPSSIKVKVKKDGRSAKRTPEQMSETIDAIVKMLRGNKEGLSSEQLQKNLDLDKSEIQRPLILAVERKLVRKEGEKRSTRYFVGGGGGAARKASTKKATPKKAASKKAKAAKKTAPRKAKAAAPKSKPAPKKAAPKKAKVAKPVTNAAAEPDAPALKIAGA